MLFIWNMPIIWVWSHHIPTTQKILFQALRFLMLECICFSSLFPDLDKICQGTIKICFTWESVMVKWHIFNPHFPSTKGKTEENMDFTFCHCGEEFVVCPPAEVDCSSESRHPNREATISTMTGPSTQMLSAQVVSLPNLSTEMAGYVNVRLAEGRTGWQL